VVTTCIPTMLLYVRLAVVERLVSSSNPEICGGSSIGSGRPYSSRG